ncbi:ankyrin repeat domain-containing protein [Kaarinaea lacus]
MLYKSFTLALLLLLQLLFISVAHSAFYKWVDKNGQVHYTQTPPPADQLHKNPGSQNMPGTTEEQKLHQTLIGNWVGDRKGEKVYVNFNYDGRFEDRTQDASRFRYNGVGVWNVSGEMIKWEYEQGKGNWSYIKGKTKHFSFIENISENELVLREPDGTMTKLKRITDSDNANGDAEGIKAACSKPFDASATPGEKWKIIIDNECNELAGTQLGKGLDPNAVEEGKAALIYAMEKQRRSIVLQLIRNGADVNSKRASDGATPLIVAAQMGDYQLVNTLITAGASIEEYNQEKCTALIVAAKENNNNIVKKLLSVGANINAVDDGGLNALKHAQDRGHRDVVKAIQDYKKLTGIK